ncbi:hypothetical protein [Pseudoalteromonas xiamenensis]|uniref:B box-type domain-containing protein n=1 Tax=Pseudoalteromonas xiamenensis TaxID=882626 RepID=A0A975DM67_9GAMM|nr:hypothetical protein [Pseudoalteromonas xiamenensis]QTH72981.1 hypothetical protein J5O05_17635 [Pseudoalteromonas xiamenensis]
MKCFSHNVDAVGICKSCNKAVCITCAIDTGRGLACSENCQQDVTEINIITDKSKQLYGIGTSGKLLPTNILMYFFFAAAFLGFGTYKSISNEQPDLFLLVIGGGFLIVAALAWHRNKNLNINC